MALMMRVSRRLGLFFLDVANYADWDTDQHYSNVIIPQSKLCDYFLANIRKYQGRIIGDRGGTQILHAKFGEYRDLKGHVNSIFNDRLSGVELSIDLLFKTKNCTNVCIL